MMGGYTCNLPKWAQKSGWTIRYEDTDGVYMKSLGCLRYLFASVTDMDDACGSDNEGHPRYAWEAYLVDLIEIPPEELHSAIRSGIGHDALQEIKDNHGVQIMCDAMAEACHSHGIKAILDCGNVDGDHFEWARARAMRAGDAAIATEEELNERLDRTVNKIGSTARDFLRGDITAGLRRSAEEIAEGKREPTAEERIMMKMHSVCKGMTLGGKTTETVALSDICSEALKKVGIPDGREEKGKSSTQSEEKG